MARGVNEEFAPPTINPGAITCRGDRALMTAYQTDSESGKGAAEPYRRDRLRLFFFNHGRYALAWDECFLMLQQAPQLVEMPQCPI